MHSENLWIIAHTTLMIRQVLSLSRIVDRKHQTNKRTSTIDLLLSSREQIPDALASRSGRSLPIPYSSGPCVGSLLSVAQPCAHHTSCTNLFFLAAAYRPSLGLINHVDILDNRYLQLVWVAAAEV